MTVEQRFIACDGKDFKTEKECIEYEKSNRLKDIIPVFKMTQEICNEHERCDGCIFYNTSIKACTFTGRIPSGWHI